MSSARTPRRTLWEEGRHPGRLVRTVAVTALLLTAFIDVLLSEQLSLLFDVVFVALCLAAALAVRPRDFFIVGVLPPLMMFGVVLLLSFVSRDVVAEPGDGVVQAVVSGLAHHAGALVTGYLLTFFVLAVRQAVLRNGGTIRAAGRRSPRPAASRSPARPGANRSPARPTNRVAEPVPAPRPDLTDGTPPDTVELPPQRTGSGARLHG
ncbi:DUF6542 domain-containing protein [Nocardioides mesophilus]|uniref:DUF6542 domain-containing protein n=1 Tax=Nocardioides mesophilus TaxID=433659 RepID=A0A7G9R7V7_9ACTN|nr:DUF6542 domain-containing protein [Nocardioides mesophilus]QNN51682.1 hypothetical protein H9L09_14060 [Nocardioides mesophilus]